MMQYGKAKGETESFLADLVKLFDISMCHCPLLLCSNFNLSTDCNFPKESKIPALESSILWL